MNALVVDRYAHPPGNCIYVKVSLLSASVGYEGHEINLKCDCELKIDSQCTEENCCCIKKTGQNYANSILVPTKLPLSVVYECTDLCSCSLNCENRVVQKGPDPRLEIKLTKDKGYGVFTLGKIPKGSFICEYAGEIISAEFAAIRSKEKDSAKYLLHLKEHYGNTVINTYYDAHKFSNIGRYINHSCSPNCTIIPTRIGSIIPRAAIFALQDLEKGEEVTYSYGEGTDYVGQGSKCLCGSDNCSGFLPTFMYVV